MITSIAAAVGIFALLIVVHEAGHFFVAKRLGVRVLRFSIGYPPRIFGIRRGETDYAIGATPFGGYVRMLGDEVAEQPSSDTIKSYLKEIELDLVGAAKATGWLAQAASSRGELTTTAGGLSPATVDPKSADDADDRALSEIAVELAERDPDPSDDRAVAIIGRPLKTDERLLVREVSRCGSSRRAIEALAEAQPSALLEAFHFRAFPSQRLAKRFAIVLAGPFSNIIFAPILMIIVLMVGIPTLLPVVGTATRDLPAFAAGLHNGDRIVAVDGKKIGTWDELSDAVRASNGAPLQLSVSAGNGSVATRTVTPKRLPEQTMYGKMPTWVIGVTPRGDKISRRYAPLDAIKAGSVQTVQMMIALCVGIARIFDGATPVRQALGGPIMIAQIAGREAHQGFADLALFTVMLSLELGIINLLPVPLLDGGHLLFFAIEGLRGKPLQLRHREIAMQVGLFLLVVLMAFVILNDISRIVG
ncbi:MAG TPA: RIP metalloprotease RseP [Candidatus Binataceae bacterium]|nr:RIP metalloprotease RseP [Candidatus Binataceae bacterium]